MRRYKAALKEDKVGGCCCVVDSCDDEQIVNERTSLFRNLILIH